MKNIFKSKSPKYFLLVFVLAVIIMISFKSNVAKATCSGFFGQSPSVDSINAGLAGTTLTVTGSGGHTLGVRGEL